MGGSRRFRGTVGVVAEVSRAVLVTGCSSGIGRATAAVLAGSGWVVYATARRPEALDELAAAGCRVLRLDVTDEESRAAAVAEVTAAEGAVGVLVNNAGFSQSGPVEAVALDDARRQFETNFFGPARLTQLVLPGMRAQGWGKVVNISSMGGRLTFPGGGYYHATKYALEALSDALRFEVAGFGVDVVLVEPGFIRTGFSDAAAATIERPAGAGASGGSGDAVEDPYRDFTAGLLTSTREVYRRGVLSRLAGDPDDVAEVVRRAITAPTPKARYPVTASARILRALRVALPDRAWDGLVGRQFSQPGGRRG
jgi:NAD(P)-dependent dehydrogenase (short-subunit alcohol dehydrogenase family)